MSGYRAARFGLGAVAWLLSCAGAAEAAAAGRLTVVAEGKSRYAIVVPDDADQGRIAQAAQLLQTVIAQAAGARLPIVKESALQRGTPAFFLGKSQAARTAGLPVDKVKGWAYLNQVSGHDIFLVGEDLAAGMKTRHGELDLEYLGTLKAVTAFLEDQVGVRFFMPGEYGRYIPKLERLTVDAGMKVSWAPPFDYVIGRAPQGRAPYARVCAVALNLFRFSPLVLTYGGHSYSEAVPATVYAKTHPEYFALIGGVRTSRRNHLCISNPDVQELMLKEMEKQLDKGYQWVELAQTDGYQPCQCAECAALHPDPGERLWIVHRKLAEEMRKRRPGKKVMIQSYVPTRNPPKTFKRFPDNVVIQMSYYTPDEFKAWKRFSVDKTVVVKNWGYWLVPGYGPKRTPRYVVEQVRMFLKNRVRGIYICGGYQGGEGGYGLEGPSYYAYGKALGDPDRDPDELLEEYVNAAFGKAAAPMLAFFKAMHDRLEVFSLFNRPITGHGRVYRGLLWLGMYSVFDPPNTPVAKVPAPFATPEEYYCHFFPPKLLDDMSRKLRRGKKMAADQRVKANLRLVEIEFNYVKNLASIFHLYRAYRVDPSWNAFDVLAAKVQERKRMIDGLFPGGHPMRIKGLPSPFIGAPKARVEAGGKNRAFLGAPLNWDFPLLRKRGVLPGVGGTKSVKALRVSAIVLDGRLDDPAWQKPGFEEMSERSMGALKNATRFKVAYGEENVYFGFVCEFDLLEPLEQVKPVGRDGAAWRQECLDIMLDPYGKREKHYQFMLNPVPNSTYDARYAFIKDREHPLYGKRDSSWNGKWQYATVIDRKGKRWTAEVRIPFTTLGVDPPGPGTRWTMNVGRTEYPGGYKKGPVNSIWSPNLEAGSFHDRSRFGDVIFR